MVGRWLSNQTTNYKTKKDGMKDPERYQLWTEFLEEYKEYFNNNKSDTNNSLQEEKEEEEIIVVPKKKVKKSMDLAKPTLKPKPAVKETPEQKRVRVKSQISELHKTYKTLKSSNLKQRFQEDPSLWHTYHAISEENEQSFPEDEIPRNRIIQELNKIKSKRQKSVVDMGCGKANISEYFKGDGRFIFTNYDHIAINDTVTECDISKLPLEDNSVEICILSLAMWGSNCKEYIMEAHRILESKGSLYIIEPTKRWSDKDDDGNLIEGRESVKLKEMIQENGFKILEENIAKFSLFVCIKL